MKKLSAANFSFHQANEGAGTASLRQEVLPTRSSTAHDRPALQHRIL